MTETQNDFKILFGRKLKRLRKRAGMTQVELAS